jgi:hypothetical protein
MKRIAIKIYKSTLKLQMKRLVSIYATYKIGTLGDQFERETALKVEIGIRQAEPRIFIAKQ